MAKFCNGGSSHLLQGRDLLDLVLSHVGYEIGMPEQDLSYHSPLISFSESQESAFRFSNRKETPLRPCKIYEASHFIWQFEAIVEGEIEPGRYAFMYKTDSSNCLDFVREQFWRGFESVSNGGPISGVALPLLDAIAGVYADLDQNEHYAEIIDVVTFIDAKKALISNEKLATKAINRAERDREWLIYPMDPMSDGLGYSGRLGMSKHLSVFQCLSDK